jgi:hypothetical protein
VKEVKRGGAENFAKAIEEKVGAPTEVVNRRSMMTVVVRDLDLSVTAEDIRDAIEKTSGVKARDTDIIVGVPRQSPNGYTFSATVRLPRSDGILLVERKRLSGGVRGWNLWSVTELVQLDRCFNCQQFGHRSIQCKEERKNRPNRCYRCAQEGHIARDCKAEEPSCYVCNAPHPANSMACPQYRACVTKEKGGANDKEATTATVEEAPKRTKQPRHRDVGGGWKAVGSARSHPPSMSEAPRETTTAQPQGSDTETGDETHDEEMDHDEDGDATIIHHEDPANQS